MRVAFQGEPGAYSEEAIRLFEGSNVERLPRKTFQAVFEAVSSRAAPSGVIPIENSIAGPVIENQDLLLQHPLSVTGETVVRVRHCLLTKPLQPLASLKTVHSHPQALSQCANFIEANRLLAVPEYDTAGSAKLLSEGSLYPGSAAIASRAAAEIYGLEVQAEGIEDRENHTRFYRIGPSALPAAQGQKTAIAFAIANAPGQLSRALGAFAHRNINILRIHSRPDPRQQWCYLFYLEFENTPADAVCAEALAELGKFASMVRNFGSYSAFSAQK